MNMHPSSRSLFIASGLALAATALLLVPAPVIAQGSLTPPGAPAPTMKTLAQIEPRTPISSLPFTISQPGSYHLTSNLTGNPGGITIAASGVTVDLMGFELVGGTGDGIAVDFTRTNIAVRNGSIRGWTGEGVDSGALNSQWERLAVSSNAGVGIAGSGNGTTISGCTARSNGVGIMAGNGSTVIGCTAISSNASSATGITVGSGSTVSGCTAQSNPGDGISVSSGSLVRDCSAFSNGGDGIDASDGVTVTDSTASQNTGRGFVVTFGSTISGSTASRNNADGLVAGAGSTLSGCTAQANTGNGISTSVGSTVIGCTAYLNTINGITVGDGSTVKDCTARSNTNYGIETAFDCTVTSCTVRRNDGLGIVANTGNTISECTVAFNGGEGIYVTSDCLVRGNNSRQNGRITMANSGIYAVSSRNRIDSNNVTGNYYGIRCSQGGNIIIRNTASANTNNYGNIAAGNDVGAILAPGGTNFSTNNAWANFSY